MINNTPRYISICILDKIFNEGAYSNLSLQKYLDNDDIKCLDKNLITEIVYGTLKYKLTLDNIIKEFVKQFDEKDISTIILRSAIYQIKYLDKVPEYAILNDSVNISKQLCNHKSNFINGVLRNYLRSKNTIELKKNTLENEYSFNSWMIKLFKNQFPNKYIKIMETLNKRGETIYRVNTMKYTREELIDKFDEYKFEIIENSSNAVKIKNMSNVSTNFLYKQGILSIQDISSQKVCEILNPEKGDVIIDLCAAPGGKSTYLAELFKDSGKIYSCDIYEHKLRLIDESRSRLSLKSIECVLNDGTIINKDFIDIGDKVLVDAPCSGFGVINKKPEIKWFKTPKDLEEIINIQKKIIKIASKYVKRGGILMYTTCTINRNENEKVVLDFLKENENFVLEQIDIDSFKDLDINYYKGMVTLIPSEINDGFFISRLRRI